MHDNVKVIIARYKEDIAWTRDLGYDFVIYDKGGDLRDNAIYLDNIGREAHTYLTHIITQYDNLAEFNVFVQGNPFDHLDPSGEGSVNMLKKQIADVVDRKVPFKGFAWLRIMCDPLGRPHDLFEERTRGKWAGWGKDIPVGEVFEKLFPAKVPGKIIARGAAGIFSVSGERIRTRPREFYEYALSLVEADPYDENNTGHAFERLWQFIFNGNLAWNRDSYNGL